MAIDDVGVYLCFLLLHNYARAKGGCSRWDDITRKDPEHLQELSFLMMICPNTSGVMC